MPKRKVNKGKPAKALRVAGYDHTIRFWEALSGICSRTIPHPDSQVNRLCISPDKRFLAAAGHHTVKLYDIKSTNPNPVLTFDGHTANITGVAFHCDGKWMVTSSEDGTVKIWDTRSGGVQRNYTHGMPVNDVVIHPNQGELISCDRGGNVRVWDLGENKCSHQLIPEDDISVASVTVASDGTLLCAGNNAGNVYVWRMIQNRDITSLVPVCKFVAHNTYITRVLLSPTCGTSRPAPPTTRRGSGPSTPPRHTTPAAQSCSPLSGIRLLFRSRRRSMATRGGSGIARLARIARTWLRRARTIMRDCGN
ncbi:TOR complex subunit lst8 [Coniosporium tulheliwenetii]|uniref:TOR complex subunit lst8 n=1 Tax=Coniosporium tulheliwenetii TaxID=3383036 RepID=A0ACC2Z5N6_9PEZI|nr:TOR complex subunit lst8 [Cladosporium sp. JES 115]